MKHDESTLDSTELETSIAGSINSYFRGMLYFPSRIRYLDHIRRTIDNLAADKRYLLLALNSSVSMQRILGDDGYDFKAYFTTFRNRHLDGDLIFRLYAVPSIQRIPISGRLLSLREMVRDLGLADCMNTYLTVRPSFNCVYIVPLKGKKVENSSYRREFDDCVRNRVTPKAWTRMLSRLLAHCCEIDGAICFHEILDYDTADTEGCGFKTRYSVNSKAVKKELGVYGTLFASSTPLESTLSINHVDDFDFGLIVALPEELEAVRRQLDGASLIPYRTRQGITLYKGTFKSRFRPVPTPILVALLPETGNIYSATAATILIHDFGVKFLISLGIAGGLRGKVNLGDIIVGDTVVYYEKSKVQKGGVSAPDFRIITSKSGGFLAKHSATRFRRRLTVKPPSLRSSSHSHQKSIAHINCAIGSGEKVIGDPKVIDAFREKVMRKVVAVENEAAGVFISADAADGDIRYIAIKGISDFADEHKGDGWHSFAADAAAAYAFDMLGRYSQ